MPLRRYGVLSGTLYRTYRDQPDLHGKWFHVNVEVDAPAGRYHCAVDVDSKSLAAGVAWKVLTLPASAVPSVAGFAPGYQDLARTATSGALDYLRHPALRPRPGCLFARAPDWLPAPLSKILSGQGWTFGSNLDAAKSLESILVPGRQVAIFGEPFTSGFGMHNIHQNQGDPAGSQWWDENGIWQDGGTIAERPDGLLDIFLSKFSTQSDVTDSAGHPS